jgi:predicted DNA-binding transcriptional regulator AlpA
MRKTDERKKTPAPKSHHIDKRAESILAIRGSRDGLGDDDELLSTKQVADWLHVSTQFLSIGRAKKYGPKFVRLSHKQVAYRRCDVRAWLTERTFASTKEYAERELER